MCRKLIYLVSFVLVLGLVGSASAALPQGWQSQDINTTGGSADESGGTWTISGDGADIWGNSDAFHYAYVPLSGDGMIIARVVDNGTGSNTWAKGGVMIRETLEAGSKHVIMVLTGGEGGGKGFQCRPSTGGGSLSAHGGGVEPPLWVKLVREGNLFTGYFSTDGVVWEQQPDGTGGDLTPVPAEIEMATDVYIGVCVTSHAAGEVRTYTFDNVGTELPKMALRPVPADGAIHPDTWASLAWAPGATAVSHDVYFGENFDDVNDRVPEVFQGNQATTFFVVGFPGFPYPDGLIPGTTYYWLVDEVEADGTTKYEGKVWSFMVPPKKAYNPVPADGGAFIDPNTDLSWDVGFGAKLHHLYFGDNAADVEAGTGDTYKGPMGAASYTLDTLELEKTYYWRVDEFDGITTHTGDVLSFTTAKAGGGVRGDYYKGMDLRNLVLTRIDPQINFSWGDPGGPDDRVGVDNFSARWTGEVGAQYTETYTFYTNSDDGVRLWIDGQQLVDNWTDHGTTEDSGTIDLVAGNVYSVVMEYYENGSGAVAQLRWESPSTPKQLIPTYVLSPPVKASSPSPPNGGVDVKQTPILKWGAGDAAASHQVYFGTDEEAIRNANTGSPEYKGTKDLGSESYDPGKLEWATTYYWRVDEVNNTNPDSPWVGSVWSFTTANFIVVDDFEDYDAGENQIWYAWHDGLGYGAPGSDPYYAGNGTGSAVGNETTASYTEETIIHSGSQAMPLFYDNNKQGFFKYSEAEMTLTYPRDWTEKGVDTLTIWFRGNPAGFVEEPAGTYTMSGAGTDIWDAADEFRYAYKQLSGDGSIVAQVLSVENTNGWAKAGVMIRESLEPGSKHAFVCITPGNGVASQGRSNTGASSFNTSQSGITAPYWVKLERDAAGNFTGYHSADGVTWQPIQGAEPQLISMSPNVYIGLALTSHTPGVTCVAEFSNVQTTGTVSPLMWTDEAIGVDMAANSPEPMYVALNGSAVVSHDNPNAALINEWTEWNIDLQAFGVNLANVNTIALGLGDKSNPQAGGSGTMYFDDIRLVLPEPTVEILFEEDFEGLTLGPNVDEELAGEQVWTDTPPAGWAVDESGIAGIGDPNTDGVTEWAGWAFADKAWWTQAAEDQNRSQFELGSGTVAVADPDEWDDADHPGPNSENPYDTWLSTPAIDISACEAGSLQLKFDSSWRPEFDDNYHQTATVTVSFDGAEPIEVLLWESDGSSPNFKPDATNETVIVDLQNPAEAASAVLTFGLFDAGNDWWWAIDNVEVSGLTR